MPKGVEHSGWRGRDDAPAVRVKKAVMPKGVEHTGLCGSASGEVTR